MTRHLRISAAAILLGVVGLVVWQTQRNAPDHAASDGFVEHLLTRDSSWQTHSFAHGHLHFLPNSHAARTKSELEKKVNSARDSVLRFFAIRDTALPIELFFVDSRDQMRELVGRPIGGMVQSGARTAIFVYNAGYKPFLVHELTHLYTHYHWGSPRARWISEGAAMLASGKCQGHTVDELAHTMERRGAVVEWRRFPDEFDNLNEIPANIQAASMVGFIRRQFSNDGLRDAWMGRDWSSVEELLQMSVSEMEARWTGDLRKGGFAELDTVKLKAEGC